MIMSIIHKFGRQNCSQIVGRLLVAALFTATMLAPVAVSRDLQSSPPGKQSASSHVKKQSGHCAIIDTKCKVINEASWYGELKLPRRFKFGVAVVGVPGARGLMDKNGMKICDPVFEDIGEFTEGLAPVVVNKKVGYIDTTGTIVIDPFFDAAASFAEGLAAAQADDKIGFIDKTGKWIIQPQFDMVSGFSEGLCDVRVKDDHFFIGKTGTTVLAVNNGLSLADWTSKIPCSALFLFDKRDKEPINFNRGVAINSQFSDGLAPIISGGKAGFIDKTGKFAIVANFDETHPFKNGLARVKAKGLYGYINTKGCYVIKPKFQQAYDFCDGLAAVEVEPYKWTYINVFGKYMTKRKYLLALPHEDGQALVEFFPD